METLAMSLIKYWTAESNNYLDKFQQNVTSDILKIHLEKYGENATHFHANPWCLTPEWEVAWTCPAKETNQTKDQYFYYYYDHHFQLLTRKPGDFIQGVIPVSYRYLYQPFYVIIFQKLLVSPCLYPCFLGY